MVELSPIEEHGARQVAAQNERASQVPNPRKEKKPKRRKARRMSEGKPLLTARWGRRHGKR